MSTDTSKIGSAMSFGLLAIGCVVGVAIYYFAGPKCPEPADPVVRLDLIGVYDSGHLRSMTTDDAWGIRFYLATDDAGAFKAIAVPIKDDGRHIPDDSGDLRFRLYKSMTGSGSDMTMLDDAEAEAHVKRSGTAAKPAWCVEATKEAVRKLMAVADCNAIAIIERNTTLEDWTFDLVAVKIDAGDAAPLGGMKGMRVGAPCPNFCGHDPAYYLHTR